MAKEDIEEHYEWDDNENNDGFNDDEKEEVKKEKRKKKNVLVTKEKKKEKKDELNFYIIAIAVIVIVGLALLIIFSDKIFKTKENEKAVLDINGEKIYLSQLEKEYNLYFFLSGLPEEYKKMITKASFLNSTFLNEMLLLNDATQFGIKIDETEIGGIIKQLLDSNKKTEDELKNDLKNAGIEYEDFKGLIKTRAIINSLVDAKITKQINITDREIEDYYEKNPELFIMPESVRASHILVKSEDEAKEILKDLDKGGNFSEIAKSKSIEPAAKSTGGDLGYFTKGQMVKEFEDAAFKLKVEEISPIVKTQFGYHIIKLTDKMAETKRKLDDVKKNIEEVLILTKQNAVLKTYIDQLRSRADIKIYYEVLGEEGKTEITKNDIKQETPIVKEIKTFKETGEDICKENGKPIIRMFSASIDSHSKWVKSAFEKSIKKYEGSIASFNWEIDTGDNTLTEQKENKIPKSEFAIYINLENKGAVPTFVFGCKYTRTGTAFEKENDLNSEEVEFDAVIEKLIEESR